ncbi:MAG: PEP-CTERM sorting domain-containing protein [Phycisphaerae bacterium]|jgi:hypothetical protein
MKKLITVCLLAVAVCLLTSTASATILGTVNIQNHNNNLSDAGGLGGSVLAYGNYYTGVYSWTNAGGTGLGTSVPNWGFCIELTQGSLNAQHDVIPLNEAPLPVTAITPMGITKADAIRELWGRNFDPTWATGANRQMAEAFSACIWEIVWETDSTLNVTTGTGFYSSIEQAATANSWLSQLTGDQSYFAMDLVAISNEGGQDFVVQVPEPATVAILSLGGLLLFRKK